MAAPEILVRGRDYAVVRPREDHAADIARDRLPAWLEPPGAKASRGVA